MLQYRVKPLFSLVGLLLAAFVIFFALSLCRDGVPLWDGATLKTATFVRDLFGDDTSAPADTTATTDPATTTAEQKEPEAAAAAPAVRQPMDTVPKTILFIGDSMLDGLQPRMAAYANHNGHKLYGVRWYSSTTEVWGSSTRLKQFIGKYKPDYVIICLGANELFVRDIKAKRQRYVDEMLRQIGTLPYIWIGPPNWREDTGINDMLAASCRKGSFYLSKNDKFERGKDGAHPTRASAAAWCDRVCRWIVNDSYYPIRLDTPDKKFGTSNGTEVLQPNQK